MTDTTVPAWAGASTQSHPPAPRGQCSCLLLPTGNLAQERLQKLAQIFSLITRVIKLRGLINSPENASLITKQHQLTEAQVHRALGWMRSPDLSYLSQLPAWALQAAPKGPGEGKATRAVLASLTWMRGQGNPVKYGATAPHREHALTQSYGVITIPPLCHGYVCWGNL